MSKHYLIAGFIALGLGATGTVHAQTATPPERLNGSSTTNNPATATTPQPGAIGTGSTPATAPSTPGTPGDTTTSSPTAGSARTDAAPRGPTVINNAVNTSPENKPGAPVSGANSFTEGQARSRLEDRGFGQISDLKLDTAGVWRAQATKDGKPVAVALDYQGNIVAQ